MSDGEKVADFVARVTSVAQRLKDMNMEQQQLVIVTKILGSSPSKYDHVRTTWHVVPRADQTVERLTDHLVNEETLLSSCSGDASTSDALNVQARQQQHNKDKGQSSKKFTRTQKRPQRQGKCHFSGLPGHWVRDCLKKREEQDNKAQASIAQSTQARTENREELFTASNTEKHNRKDIWIADSGAAEHISHNRQWFTNYETLPEGSYTVRVGDGTNIPVRGRGDTRIAVQQEDGETQTHTVGGVLHVPEIEKNLISVSKSTQRGFDVNFLRGGCSVVFSKEGKVILSGEKCNNLYKLNLRPLVTTKESEASQAMCVSMKTWHERLGHVNYRTLKQMQQSKAVEGLQFSEEAGEDPFCEGCVYGKQH